MDMVPFLRLRVSEEGEEGGVDADQLGEFGE